MHSFSTYALYPSYFKLQVRWLRSLTPVTYQSKLQGFTLLPPSCNSNYLGYRLVTQRRGVDTFTKA